jgi:serine protease AprX
MIKRFAATLAAATLLLCVLTGTSFAAKLDPTLQSKIASLADSAGAGVVIVSFNTDTGLDNSHLAVLQSLGINKGLTLKQLGMVAFPATVAQVRALVGNSAVRSVWANHKLSYFNNESRILTGVDRLRADSNLTRANGGLPVSGKGDFSVVINDSGIDARHPDLQYPDHVVQNVQLVTDTTTLTGFTPLIAIENLPDTDTNSGHGTHCAGIVGGNGAASGGLYAGVAPGAKLIGTGSGAVLLILNALGGFEWSLTHQAQYGIRIISNSFGGGGAFDPADPLNIATRIAHDRNIIVVFAGGNSGPGKDTYNPYAKAPWVIGVAAGTKEGGLASFSSRGTPRAQRLADGDPLNDYDAPTITAPGTGREFESNAGKFTAAIVSTRAATGAYANGTTDDAELSPAALPFYTQISGTSMATPFVAGVAALLLDADPTLTPDQVKEIITQTASQMPGFEDYEVGAGYINAYAAVDKVFNRGKKYGSYTATVDTQKFNAKYTVSGPAPESFHLDYNPAATPGPGSANSRTFTVKSGMSVLDVFATFDTAAEDGEGNTIGVLLTAPDGSKYSSGVALPILDSPSRQVIVKNPLPGEWLLEARGVRGLAAAPNVSLPTTGAAAPGPVDGTITQLKYTLAPIADIKGHPAQAQIESALKNRMMDTFSNGTFQPDANLTRGDFAKLLMLNTPLRQSLGATAKFGDVSGTLAAIAEAVTANGSTLRDYNFAPAGMIKSASTSFNPSGLVSRLDVAVALVRALGLDAEAKAKANSNVTATYNGQQIVLMDNADIPASLRGYVQLAIDKGILQVFYTTEQGPFDFQPTLNARVKPNANNTRAFMAYALDNYRQHFLAGN